MKNRKANLLEDVTYTVVAVYQGKPYTYHFSVKELFFYNENTEEREIVFCLCEDFETILKMNHGDQMPIKISRDADEWGIIERTN